MWLLGKMISMVPVFRQIQRLNPRTFVANRQAVLLFKRKTIMLGAFEAYELF
jgi:hypothetical protein